MSSDRILCDLAFQTQLCLTKDQFMCVVPRIAIIRPKSICVVHIKLLPNTVYHEITFVDVLSGENEMVHIDTLNRNALANAFWRHYVPKYGFPFKIYITLHTIFCNHFMQFLVEYGKLHNFL